MTRTFDVVIAGSRGRALAAAAEAVRQDRSVLVVLSSGGGRAGRRFRQGLCRTISAQDIQVMVITDAEVVCVAGIRGVEAVVIRHIRTGRLCAVNASAFVSCNRPRG